MINFAINIKAVTPITVEKKFKASNCKVTTFDAITTTSEIMYTIQSFLSNSLNGFFIFTFR